MKAFKRHRDYGFFDQDFRLTKLSKLGNPLEKLSNDIDFEMLRNILYRYSMKIVHFSWTILNI